MMNAWTKLSLLYFLLAPLIDCTHGLSLGKNPIERIVNEKENLLINSQFFSDNNDQDMQDDLVTDYFKSSLLYSEFIYTIANLRNIVKKHDHKIRDGNTTNPDWKVGKIFTPKFVELVNFTSTGLIYTQPFNKDKIDEDDDKNLFLRYDITTKMLMTFISENRKYLKKGENIEFTDKKKEGEKDGLERTMGIFEMAEEKADIHIVEFDDQFRKRELVYAIVVNNVNKRINVVFRGSVTGQDWKQNLQFKYLDPSKFKEKKNSKFISPEDLKLCSTETNVKFHSGFADYLFGPTPEPEHFSKFDKIVETLKELVHKYEGYDVVITGHSLGGALTQLLAFALASSEFCQKNLPLPIRAVSFASPAVGNKGYQEQFKKLEAKGLLRHIRFTNQGDVVPVALFLVPGYTQTGLNMHVYKKEEMNVNGFGNTKSFLSQVSLSALKNHSPKRYMERTLNGKNGEYLDSSIDKLYGSIGNQEKIIS